MLGVAVVGVGLAGSLHVNGIHELALDCERRGQRPDLRVEMLIDSDIAQLESKASEFGIRRTAIGLASALADPSVDVIAIATPHTLHRDAAIDAARAGKHIVVEKPMAIAVDDATIMIEEAERAGVVLFVAESFTYGPMAKMLRQLLSSSAYIGELTFVSVTRGFRAEPRYEYKDRRAWLARPAMGGSGTWLLHGIHTVAGIRYVIGEIDTVFMREHHTKSFDTLDVEGTMSGTLTTAQGLSVSLTQTCETRLADEFYGFTLYGENGTIRAGRQGADIYVTAGNGRRQQSKHVRYDSGGLSQYALEYRAFADHVVRGEVAPTDGRSERRTLAIIQAGYESASSGAVVNLSERFGDI